MADQILQHLGARPVSLSKYAASASLMDERIADNDVRHLLGRQLQLTNESNTATRAGQQVDLPQRQPRRTHSPDETIRRTSVSPRRPSPRTEHASSRIHSEPALHRGRRPRRHRHRPWRVRTDRLGQGHRHTGEQPLGEGPDRRRPTPAAVSPAQVADTATDVAAQKKQASALINGWVAAHGTKKDDKAFVTWIEQVFPTPPADLTAQMPAVVALDKKRTAPGVAAATWLEAYGKKDIWKLYVHDQREVLAPSTGDDRKAEEKALLKMSKKVADDLGMQIRLIRALRADAFAAQGPHRHTKVRSARARTPHAMPLPQPRHGPCSAP